MKFDAPPGHGKTCFLSAVCQQLAELGHGLDLDSCRVEWLEESHLELDRIETHLGHNLLPPTTTSESQPIGLRIHSNAMGSFPLSFADRQDPQLAPEPAPDFQLYPRPRATVVLLDPARWMDEVGSYVDLAAFGERLLALTRTWDATRPNQFILVVNCADRLPDLPDKVREHLISDSLSREPVLGNLETLVIEAEDLFTEEYWQVLQENSQILLEWFKDLPGGAEFLSLAQEYRWDLSMCAVSALGSSPDKHSERLILPWSPKRCLDPLISCLNLELGR